MCERWVEAENILHIKKGFHYKGSLAFFLCRDCANKIVLKRREKTDVRS